MSNPSRSAQVGAVVGIAIAVAIGYLPGCAREDKSPASQARKFRPADEESAEPAATDAAALEANPLAAAPALAAPNTAAESAVAAAPGAPAANASGRGDTTKESPKAPALNVAAPLNAAAASKAAGDPAAPGGNVKELLALIDKLAQQPPQGATQQEQLEDFVRIQQQRLAACQKVMASNADAPTKARIVEAMFEVYQLFRRLGVPGAQSQLVEFAKSLARDASPEIARKGQHALFGANISQIASQPLADGKRIVAEVQALLDAEQGALSDETFSLIDQTAQILTQSGLREDAAAVFELAGAAAAADPKHAERAKRYAGRAKLSKVDLETLLTDLLTDQKDAEAKLMQAVTALLADAGPTRELFSNLQQVVMIMEATGHLKAAQACLDQIETAYKDVNDEQLKMAIARSTAGVRKRAGLIGQTFTVEGVTLDGKPFDWSPYQGKVVLVDFWATWCGPCLEELPNIRSNFEQFHARGFDVVGVNLNTELDEVKQFFTVQDLPWATVLAPEVLSRKANEDWTQLPMAAKCGVDAIPFLVLVGKDGKVDSLHVRGPKLKSRLTELLGEPPPVQIPLDPTVPPGAKSRPAGKTGAVRPEVRGRRSEVSFLSPATFLMAQAILAADPSAPAAKEPDEAAANPYLAKPGLGARELAAYIEKMLDKPKTIQSRAGFAEAIAEACDRVLAADPPAKEAELLSAAETKFMVLHRAACAGDQAADEQLLAFVEKMKADPRPKLAREVAFYRLERRVLQAAELPLEGIPGVLQDVQEFVAKEKLTDKHVRLASSTVALVNRLENGDERERHFTSLGEIFAKSSDKQLARYGKKLAKKPAGQDSDLIGQPLQLTGVTAKGVPITADAYRGKVVIVDFWATWCGVCVQEMPALKSFYEEKQQAGLAVIGVSLDEDQEALAKYLDDHKIAWETIAGEETSALAEKYLVRVIPTFLVVNREGKIAAVGHTALAVAAAAEKLLAP